MKLYLIKLACWWYAGAYNRKKGYAPPMTTLDWRLVYAIAQHESADFNSDLFLRSNNCFGMRVPKKRKWYGNGETNGYSTYSSVWNSVRDYFSWVDYNGLEVNQDPLMPYVEGWVSEMKQRNYFEASLLGYSNAVQGWYDSAMLLPSPSVYFAWALPLSVIIIWNRKKILSQVKKLTKSK